MFAPATPHSAAVVAARSAASRVRATVKRGIFAPRFSFDVSASTLTLHWSLLDFFSCGEPFGVHDKSKGRVDRRAASRRASLQFGSRRGQRARDRDGRPRGGTRRDRRGNPGGA